MRNKIIGVIGGGYLNAQQTELEQIIEEKSNELSLKLNNYRVIDSEFKSGKEKRRERRKLERKKVNYNKH